MMGSKIGCTLRGLLGAWGIAMFAWAAPLSAAPLSCTNAIISILYKAPAALRVGVADVHTYRVDGDRFDTLVSIFTPTSKHPDTSILDFQFFRVGESKPKRFFSSGGGDFDTFYYFDLSEGSLLKKRISQYARFLRREFIQSRAENLQSFALDALNRELKFKKELFFAEALPEHMRTNFRVGSGPKQILEDFLSRPFTGPNPIISRESRKSLSFLAALDPARKRLCFEKVWTAALVLDELGIPNRLQFGQVAYGQPNTRGKNGHAILELENGLFFDPEWNYIGELTSHPTYPEWKRIDTPVPNTNTMWWSPYRHFPGLVFSE